MRLILSVIATSLVLSAAAFAEGPCEQVKAACQGAGFVQGQAKAGYGLWVDCIRPIMQGTAQPKKADKPLPTVSADIIAACKAKHPNFGEGHK